MNGGYIDTYIYINVTNHDIYVFPDQRKGLVVQVMRTSTVPQVQTLPMVSCKEERLQVEMMMPHVFLPMPTQPISSWEGHWQREGEFDYM